MKSRSVLLCKVCFLFALLFRSYYRSDDGCATSGTITVVSRFYPGKSSDKTRCYTYSLSRFQVMSKKSANKRHEKVHSIAVLDSLWIREGWLQPYGRLPKCLEKYPKTRIVLDCTDLSLKSLVLLLMGTGRIFRFFFLDGIIHSC